MSVCGMRPTKAKIYLLAFVLELCGSLGAARPPVAAQSLRRFTIADDVELTRFGDNIGVPPVIFSPDGRYFVVASERGRLDINRPESSLRLYRTEDVRRFLWQASIPDEPSPFWVIHESTYKDGPIITGVHWLADSTGIAFVGKTRSGNNQLFLADIRRKDLQSLTPEGRNVTAFDIRSRSRFAYTVSSPARNNLVEYSNAPDFVGTGLTLGSMIFPEERTSQSVWVNDLSELWVVIDGQRLRIMDDSSGRALPIHLQGQMALALSPDGRSVATALSVRAIPPEWETLVSAAATILAVSNRGRKPASGINRWSAGCERICFNRRRHGENKGSSPCPHWFCGGLVGIDPQRLGFRWSIARVLQHVPSPEFPRFVRTAQSSMCRGG